MEKIVRLASVKWPVQGNCVSTDCLYDAWQSTSNFWHQSLTQLLSFFSFFCLFKVLTCTILASEPVCPQGDYASYLLRPSSDRDIHGYLVELFVERLFARQEVKLRTTLDCLWWSWKDIRSLSLYYKENWEGRVCLENELGIQDFLPIPNVCQ